MKKLLRLRRRKTIYKVHRSVDIYPPGDSPQFIDERPEPEIIIDEPIQNVTTIEPQMTTPANNTNNDPLNPLVDEILRRIEPRLPKPEAPKLDKTYTEIIIKDFRPVDAAIKPTPDLTNFGEQHPAFADVIAFMQARLPVYIYGPTGSGKTFSTKMIAEEVLKLPFYRKVMSSQASESYLLGYANAQGTYVEGIAYKAYKDGGVLLIDEIDNGNANINTVVKQLSDSNSCFFPVVGNIPKHKDFYIVANANTIGNGATKQYVGRAPQDAAMLNTFAFVHWPYDTRFEERIALAEYKAYGGKDENLAKKRIDDFWKMRRAIEELAINHILSSRNLIHIMRLVAIGVHVNKITRAIIARGLEKDQFTKIVNKANLYEGSGSEAMEVSTELVSDDCPIPGRRS